MKRIWIKKANSFKEAEKFNRSYYLSLSPGQRLEIMQFLRETFYKMRRGQDESGKGLRRIIKIIQ